MSESTIVRQPGGQFGPGTKAGGRPKGFAGVAKTIMAATRDGAELVEWALSIWRDPLVPLSARWDAFQWLSDRGMGKPLAMIADVTIPTSAQDLSLLTDAELEEIDLKFRAAKERKMIEASSTEVK